MVDGVGVGLCEVDVELFEGLVGETAFVGRFLVVGAGANVGLGVVDARVWGVRKNNTRRKRERERCLFSEKKKVPLQISN